MRHAPDADVLAGLIAATLVVVLTAALLAAKPDASYLVRTFTEEHVSLLGMYDNRGQQWAYRLVLALVGALTLALWWLRPLKQRWAHPESFPGMRWLARWGGAAVAAVVIVLVASAWGAHPRTGFEIHGRYAISIIQSSRVALAVPLIGLAIAWAALSWRRRRAARPAKRRGGTIVLVAFIAYFLTLSAAGLLTMPDFRGFTGELLTGVEWHYSGSVASADRIAAGQRLGEIAIHSGLLPTVLLGWGQLVVGALDFGGHIRLTAFLQLVFAALALAAYAAWYSGNAARVALAAALALPWAHPLHAAILYPNQSAWRFIGLAFGVLVLVAMHHREPRRSALALGVAAGIAMLWNIETGLAVSAAYVGFLVVRTSRGDARSKLTVALRFVAGVAAAFAAFFVLVRLALGYWADPLAVFASFALLGEFNRGYGGLALSEVQPLAVLVFVHALYVFLRDVLRWARGDEVPARTACEAAIAGLIVAWATYYFKAPHHWNLWSYLYLYGFLVGSLLRPLPLARDGSALRTLAASPALVALATIVVPAALAANIAPLRSLHVIARAGACARDDVVSGICMPSAIARAVSVKAGALRELDGDRRAIYLTSDSYLMPALSAIPQVLPQRDPFAETIAKADFERLVQEVVERRPSRILFDDPAALTHGYAEHVRFFARVQAALADRYERAGARDGWVIWREKRAQ